MLISQPRTKPAPVRLDELMNAAQTLFFEQGFEATTVNQIVQLANVAKGTFYHYFASKNEILAALRTRYMTHFLQALDAAVGQCAKDDVNGQLTAWIFVCIDSYAKTYKEHDMVFSNHHHHYRENPDKTTFLQGLIRILEQGKQQGVWLFDDAATMALLIYSAVHGVTDAVIVAEVEDCSTFAQSVSDSFLKMLSA